MPEQTANTDWSAALAGVDCVIHCAARVHVMQESSADPLSLFREVNRDSTLNLARQAAACGVRQFIFISSIKVNGEATHNGRSFTELDTALPEDPYGISKAEAEQALLAFAANSTMAVTIIRPPLVYGPGVKANFLSMMKWVERGIPLPLGNIDNRRSFVYLDNLISLIACCIANPNAYNQIFLVSDGQDLSTTQLLQACARAFKQSSKAFPFPVSLLNLAAKLFGKQAQAERLFSSLQVDISKAQNILGWTPPYTVEQGLLATANHLKTSGKIPPAGINPAQSC